MRIVHTLIAVNKRKFTGKQMERNNFCQIRSWIITTSSSVYNTYFKFGIFVDFHGKYSVYL